MKTYSLRWLIIIPFVVLVFISGMTVYLLSTLTIANAAKSVGVQYIQEVESRIYDRVLNFMAPLSSIVEINRDAFSYRPELLDDLAPVGGRFYEQAVPYPQMTFISVATADGRYVASSRDPIGRVQHSIAANYVNNAFTMEGFEFDPVHFIGNKIQSDPSFSYDPRVRPFFLDAVKAQDVVWSPIHPYFGYPTLGIGLSTPIYSQQGKLLGVTATSVALIELDEYLASIDLVDNAYAFIAEEDGALIATSQPDELYQITDGTTTRLTLATHANRVFGKVGQSFVPGAHSIEVKGESYLYQIRPITFGYDKTWIIGVIIPEAHHVELLDEYTYSMAWITLVLFIAIALVGSLVARYIGLPIQQLNVAANNSKLESIQNLPQPISRISEVNSLANGLQGMADDLSDVMHNLEQKVAQRTSDLQEENEGLLEQSHTDELTGLYNRRGFNKVFTQALEVAQRHQKSVTFVLCDIDHFKQVNDNYGHNLGDRALAFVADNLKSHVRDEDIVARYGGEEFALVFVGAEQAQVLARLEKIRHSFAQNPVFGSYHITMSFGVSHLTSVSAASDKALISESDMKLYQAKSSGRDKIIS